MNKQDRQGVRTPAQLEEKYNFGKSFAEIMGIATDAQTAAEKAKENTEIVKTEVIRLDNQIKLTAEKTETVSGKVDTLREEAVLQPKISGQYSQVVRVADALPDSIKGLTVWGWTKQDGTPSPDEPMALKSPGDGGSFDVTTAEKNLTINKELPGIPVTSGGNYTDANGQQWIANYRDYGRGVDVQCVEKVVFDGSADENWVISATGTSGKSRFRAQLGNAYDFSKQIGLCSQFVKVNSTWNLQEGFTPVVSSGINYLFVYSESFAATYATEWKAHLAENPMTCLFPLAAPIETPIPEEEMEAFRSMGNPAGNVTIYSEGNLAVELSRIASNAALGNTNIEIQKVKSQTASLELSSDGIRSRVEEAEQQLQSKADESQLETVRQDLTEVKQTAKGLDLTVQTLSGTVAGKADQEALTEVTEHFRFALDGMTISNTATGMGIRVSEQQVEFLGAGDPTTVIRPNDMHTTNLEVETRLDLGGFSFIPRSNNNLSLRWTGGNT